MSNEQNQVTDTTLSGEVTALDEPALENEPTVSVRGTDDGTVGVDSNSPTATDGESIATASDTGDGTEAEQAPAPVVPTTEPVVVEPSRTTAPPPPPVPSVKTVTKAVDDMTVEEYVRYRNKHLVELPKVTRTIIDRMQAYCDAMGRGMVMGETKGGIWQRDLFFTLMTAIEAPDEAVTPCMDAICWFYKHHRKSCFSDAYAMRFLSAVRLTRDQLQSFQYMSHVFLNANDPASRKLALGQISMSRASSKITDLRARDNFLKYFTA